MTMQYPAITNLIFYLFPHEVFVKSLHVALCIPRRLGNIECRRVQNLYLQHLIYTLKLLFLDDTFDERQRFNSDFFFDVFFFRDIVAEIMSFYYFICSMSIVLFYLAALGN
jgi:hypothetical protein